jgi:uncharacterized membrane protein
LATCFAIATDGGSGASVVALSAAKGATLHRKSGMLFVVAIATMCFSAVVIAAVKGQTVNLIVGLMSAYLVIPLCQ